MAAASKPMITNASAVSHKRRCASRIPNGHSGKMATFTLYCGICTAPLNNCLIPSEEEECDEFLAKVAEEEEETGEPVISLEDVKWLDRCIVIGIKEVGDEFELSPEQTASEGERGSYLTEYGSEFDGTVTLPRDYEQVCQWASGDEDEEEDYGGYYGNCDSYDYDDYSGENQDKRYWSEDYSRSGKSYITIPKSGRLAVHEMCYQVFKHAIHFTRPSAEHGTVSLDAQAEVLTKMEDHDGGFEKGKDLRGQHWQGNVTSDSWFVANPVHCEALLDYFWKPPQPKYTYDISSGAWQPDSVQSNLHALPLEVIGEILKHLPRKDALNFRIASKTAAAVPLVQEFWRARIVHDAPWIWEVRERQIMESKVDWRSMYDDLVVDKYNPEFRGLRNRERIWNIVTPLAEKCWEVEEKLVSSNNFSESDSRV
ncbi:hypothetical protein BZA77DRAFT_133972 [Pyronema omphalodes]|nr:hypothetical protein BZA77DRAFT_133972 [Pyronema omphalodes]